MAEGDKYRVHETSEEDSSGLLADHDQDANIHPNELSGDENGEQSVLASSLEGHKANFFLTVMTVVKTVIGAGILSIPYSINKMGYVLGIVVFLGAGVIAQFTSVLLLKAKNLSRHSNYSTIFYEVWRSKIAKAIGSILIFLNNIGICIAELIIFKTSIRKIFQDVITDKSILDQFYTQEYFLVLIIAIFQTPLTLVSKMEKLKFMALCGVTGISIFMIAFVLFFIAASLDDNPENNPAGNMRAFPNDWLAACSAVPNLLLALSYQMNFFPIFKGMKNVNDHKMSLAALAGISFCVFSYLLVGVLGYDYVGQDTQANFLESLSYDKIPSVFFFFINIFFLLSIFFAFPIMFFGCRNNFIALAKLMLLRDEELKQQNWRRGDEVEEISSYIKTEAKADRKKKAKIHFIMYTIGIYAVIIGVSMGVQDIESVFNIIGAVCSTSIGILLPCLFYFRLVVMKRQHRGINYYIAWALLLVMAPYAIFAIIAQHLK